jgi:hypothetical protein
MFIDASVNFDDYYRLLGVSVVSSFTSGARARKTLTCTVGATITTSHWTVVVQRTGRRRTACVFPRYFFTIFSLSWPPQVSDELTCKLRVSNFDNNWRKTNRPSIFGLSFLAFENTEPRLIVSATSWGVFTSIRVVWRRRRARKEAAFDVVEGGCRFPNMYEGNVFQIYMRRFDT